MWRMSLNDYQAQLQNIELDGELAGLSAIEWQHFGLSAYDASRCHFIATMCQSITGLNALNALEHEDCAVCSCSTVNSTIVLLKERDINIAESVIREGHWITPFLVYAPLNA